MGRPQGLFIEPDTYSLTLYASDFSPFSWKPIFLATGMMGYSNMLLVYYTSGTTQTHWFILKFLRQGFTLFPRPTWNQPEVREKRKVSGRCCFLLWPPPHGQEFTVQAMRWNGQCQWVREERVCSHTDVRTSPSSDLSLLRACSSRVNVLEKIKPSLMTSFHCVVWSPLCYLWCQQNWCFDHVLEK